MRRANGQVIVQRTESRVDPATGLATRSYPSGTMTADALTAFLRGMELSGGGVRNPYETSVYVHSAIKNIAGAMASLPVRVYTAAGEPADDSEYAAMLDRPNDEQAIDEFIEAVCIHREIDGITYIVEPDWAPGRAPRTRQVVLASAEEMTPKSIDGACIGWDYHPTDGARGRFLPLTHARPLRHYHPRKRLEGLAPSTVARLAIEGHYGALDLFAAAIKNGAEIGAVFSTKQSLTDQQRRDVEETIRKRYSGSRNANLPILLSGDVTIERGSAGMRDIQWLEGMRVSAQIIATAYNVPLLFVNLMDQAQYNSSPQQVQVFWQMKGLTDKARIERALNEVILRGDRRYYISLDTSDVQALREREAEFMAKAFALPMVARNEVNRRFDLGFEDQPWGETPLAPAGNIPVDVLVEEARTAMGFSQIAEGDEKGDRPSPPRKAAEAETESLRSIRALERTAKRAADSAAGLADDRERSATAGAIQKRWEKSWQGLARTSGRRLAALINGQIEDVRNNLAKRGLPYVPAADKADLDIRGEFEEAETIEAVMFDAQEADDRLRAVMRPQLRDAAELAGKQIADEIGLDDSDFDLEAPGVVDKIDSQMNRLAKINSATANQVREALKQAFADKLTLAECDAKLAELLGETTSARGYRIAQTEIHEALSAQRNEAMTQAGVTGKKWLTSGQPVKSKANPEGIVRFSHWRAQEDSKAGIPVSEDYTLTGEDGRVEKCAYPGAGNLTPGNRIFCRCVSIAVTIKKKAASAGDRCGLYTYERMLADRRAGR